MWRMSRGPVWVWVSVCGFWYVHICVDITHRILYDLSIKKVHGTAEDHDIFLTKIDTTHQQINLYFISIILTAASYSYKSIHGTKNWIYCTFDTSQKLSQIWYWL